MCASILIGPNDCGRVTSIDDATINTGIECETTIVDGSIRMDGSINTELECETTIVKGPSQWMTISQWIAASTERDVPTGTPTTGPVAPSVSFLYYLPVDYAMMGASFNG